MRGVRWVFAAAALGGATLPAGAQTGPLAPTGGPPEPKPALAFDAGPSGQLPPEPASTTVARRAADHPTNVLGPPVMGAPVRPADREPREPAAPPPEPRREVVTAAGEEPPPVRGRSVALGAPESAGSPVRTDAVESRARTSYVPRADGDDPVSELLTNRSGDRPRERRTVDRGEVRRSSAKFGDKIGETLNGVLGEKKDWFRSDHAFDNFVSPVTNPFLFEDPRSLTEVRPIFIYQDIPNGQSDFQGGDVWFFGLQARVAVTERLSFVFNKIGGVSFNPTVTPDDTGFAELWLGPKYTIIRNEDTGSLLAAGLQFQIPIGSSGAYQNTGTLTLAPWLTYGQNFGRDWRVGSMNALINTGYAFSTDSARSDYYWLSAHLDLDVMNRHRFYPLVEMNWILNTTNGNTQPFTTEGRDLFNFGSQAKNTGMMTIAVGARYKITESAQVGTAFEFPLAGPKGMFDWRVGLDFILRY